MEKNSIKQLLMASNFYILNKHLVKTLGIETAFFLTALVEADEILADKNGWFYQTIPQIEKMTGLTKHKQTNCINELLILGILLQENKGMPMKRYFKLDYEKIAKLLSSHKKDNSQEDREGDSKEEKNQSAREEKNCHLGGEKIATNKELYINNLDKKLKTTKLDNIIGIESKSSSSSSFENSSSGEKDSVYQIKSALENYGLGVETCRNIMELVKNGRVNFERINSVLGVAKELSMVENNSRGREARVYFIQCEKKLKVAQGRLPKTYLEALKELVKLEETKLSLENRVNNLVHSRKLYTTTEIAKELGLKSANALNQLLEEDKIQYKVNGTWVLCSKYSDKEYVSIKQTELENGKIIYDRKWTGLGRNFLIERYGGTVKRD